MNKLRQGMGETVQHNVPLLFGHMRKANLKCGALFAVLPLAKL